MQEKKNRINWYILFESQTSSDNLTLTQSSSSIISRIYRCINLVWETKLCYCNALEQDIGLGVLKLT